MDTIETENKIRRETNLKRKISIFSIGPAAENRVRYSVIVGDHGHVASKNGIGAVFGAKNLKAIAVVRGKNKISFQNPAKIEILARKLLGKAKVARGGIIHTYGTAGFVSNLAKAGGLPVKNYNTNIFPAHDKINGKTLRQSMKLKRKSCWACGLDHLHSVEIVQGPYAGLKTEEPDYELVAGFGPLIGVENLNGIVMLADLVDRLGMDGNETAWAVAWVIDCYEQNLLSSNDVDGLEMNWGNVEAVRMLINKIARREGIGNLLAEGVMRAAENVGGVAKECAVFTKKGATPRMHDHRSRWAEMMDTCFSTTSTIEATSGGPFPELLGMPPVEDPFDPVEVAEANAKVNGWRTFEDCLGVCNFNSGADVHLLIDIVNAATGRELDIPAILNIGRGIIHRLRMFNLRHGCKIELEKPSPRYSSQVSDGPNKGKWVVPHWNEMRRIYYENMGWDVQTGWPLPETLKQVGLSELIQDLPVSVD